MKTYRWSWLLVALALAGCSNPEKKLTGKWESREVPGFVAEFKGDHTGSTFTPVPGHAGAGGTVPTPFKWALDPDGKLKVSEGQTTFYGKIVGDALELQVNGATSVLRKAKK